MASNVIAIDGPAASGKSSAARQLAEKLGIPYISTGSLFRAVAWKAANCGLSADNPDGIAAMLRKTVAEFASAPDRANPEVCIDGVFPGEALRAPEIAAGASALAVLPCVRAFALDTERRTAEHSLCVMEGRDVGTAVFPDARYKFFLTASPRERARRRLSQGEICSGATLDRVAAEIAERDKRDEERAEAPLKCAEDALYVDNSGMSLAETVEFLRKRVSGEIEPASAVMEYRVPYADTDQMGVVYYANYLVYFEMCRAELMRKIGLSCTEFEKFGFVLPVIEAVCRYKKSARFEDLLEITANVAEASAVRLRIACIVKCGGEVLAEGYTVHVCLNRKGRPVRIPEQLSARFGLAR